MSRKTKILLGWVTLTIVSLGTSLLIEIRFPYIKFFEILTNVYFIIGVSLGVILLIFLWRPINYCLFRRSFEKTKKAS